MMTAVSGREMSVRAVISVAGIGIPEFLAEKAVEFNRANKDFRVVLTDYSVWNEISADVMKNEIIAGRIPDIVIFGSDPYSEKYREEYKDRGCSPTLAPTSKTTRISTKMT